MINRASGERFITIKNLYFSCYGGKCVDISVLCDHFKDCPYGDDEDCCKIFIEVYPNM